MLHCDKNVQSLKSTESGKWQWDQNLVEVYLKLCCTYKYELKLSVVVRTQSIMCACHCDIRGTLLRCLQV